MGHSTRRDFLAASAQAAAALGLSRSLSAVAQAPSQSARIVVDSRRVIATLDHRLFGSFLDPLGRSIYSGIFQPASPLADPNGFRRDVISEISALAVPIVRYPGGNFVSGYDWLDGVGPRASRPAVLDRAWNSIETNQFGTNEFLAWCRMAGVEPLLALNFGTGTAEKAAALVERRRQRRRAVSRVEPRDGTANRRRRGRVRLRARAKTLRQAAVAVVRRVERVVPADRRKRTPSAGAASAGGSVRPARRARRRRRAQLADAARGSRPAGVSCAARERHRAAGH